MVQSGSLSTPSSTYLWVPPAYLVPTAKSSLFILRWTVRVGLVKEVTQVRACWQCGLFRAVREAESRKQKIYNASVLLHHLPQFKVLINRPPTNGTIQSIPSKGVSLETNFTLRTRYWVDSEADLPLAYSYSASGLSLQQGTRATRIYVSGYTVLDCDFSATCTYTGDVSYTCLTDVFARKPEPHLAGSGDGCSRRIRYRLQVTNRYPKGHL